MQKTKNKQAYIKYLPIYGCFATGIIYTAIGVIAILSFLQIRDGGADESSMMALLNDFIIGKIVVLIIMLGSVSYILWRIYETIKDPYGYGRKWSGLVKRTGIALSAIADALIVYAALRILLGAGNMPLNGQPDEEREMVASIMDLKWGAVLVMAIGCIVCITAVIQFFYGVTRGYKERIDVEHLNKVRRRSINILAWSGYVARGIILGITGFFFIKAGALQNAQYVVNTDKAFDFIGDNVGHVYFILTAVGTICYGLFMFAMGVTYDIDKD